MYYYRYPFSMFLEARSAIILHLSCLIFIDFYARMIMGSANLMEYNVTQLRSLHSPRVNLPCFFSFLQLKQFISQSLSILNFELTAIYSSTSLLTLLSINLSPLSDGSITKIFICLLISTYSFSSSSVLSHWVRILCSYCMYRMGAWILCFFYQYCQLQQQQALYPTPATTGKRRSLRMGSFLFENMTILL